MDRIWMAVDPKRHETRLLATLGPGDTLLKARLCPQMSHPRALVTLLEGLALWQGCKVHAVVAADARQTSFDWSPSASFAREETPLYAVDFAPTYRRRRREIDGVGDFRDLHHLLRREVAR